MKRPSVVAQGDTPTVLGQFFGTPVVVKGWTWLPLAEALLAGVLAWTLKRKRPDLSPVEHWKIALLAAPVVASAEWGHNFAHAAAASLVGRPMDALRITWGTPLCVYFDLEDPAVKPAQHMVRALGGPIFNAAMLPLAWWVRGKMPKDSTADEVAQAAVWMNAFLCTFSLLPVPGIDGGPLLKWGLVELGHTPRQADLAVRKVNLAMAPALGLAARWAFRRKRDLLGLLLGLFALIAGAVGLGWIQE